MELSDCQKELLTNYCNDCTDLNIAYELGMSLLNDADHVHKKLGMGWIMMAAYAGHTLSIDKLSEIWRQYELKELKTSN